MCKSILAMLVAGLAGLATCTTLRAADTSHRGISGSGTVDGTTETQLVYHCGGVGRGFGGGWGHGHYSGYRGFYGGYRGYYGGYRPYWSGYGGYRPYYFARPYHYGYYQPYYNPAYSYSPYYYTAPTYYYPLSAQVIISTPTVLAQPAQSTSLPYQAQAATAPQRLPMPATAPQLPAANQTFPYDGGPSAPVPLPIPNDHSVNSMSGPHRVVPLSGKVVSLPRELSIGTTQYTTQLVGLTTDGMQPAAPRFRYPAYGDVSLPEVRRTSK